MVAKSEEKPIVVCPREGRKGMILSSVLSTIIIAGPVTLVQAVSMIFSFSWMNALALVIVFVGSSFVINIVLIHIHDSQVWKQLLNGCLYVFDGCHFEPITIELEGLKRVKEALRYSPEKALFLMRFLVPNMRAFFVHPTGPVVPSTVTTYQMLGGTCYAFLPQRPEEMCTDARFYLLHEIGHATAHTRILHMQGWFTLVHFCLLFVFVAFHREAGIQALIVAFALVALWAHYFRLYLRQKSNIADRPELLADAFALVHLAGRPDFRAAIARIARRFHNEAKNNLFSRYQARLLVRQAQIQSRKGMKGRDQKWAQQIYELMLPAPIPLWLSLPIFAGMLWLGVTLSIKYFEELFALSLIWLIMPVLEHYYYLFLRAELPDTSRARDDALTFLRAHAPPNLPAQHHLTSRLDLV